MKRTGGTARRERRGAIVVLVALLMIPVLAMVAFAVDLGYIYVVQTQLQRAADAAVLGGVVRLVPDPLTGVQSTSAARATAREYVQRQLELGTGFYVPDSDIQILRYDPSTINSTNPQFFTTGPFDALRVTVRRDGTANSPVSLFFARIIGNNHATIVVQATAVLRRGVGLTPGSDVLPFAMDINRWNPMATGDQRSIYGDGRITDGSGSPVPGNWGRVDIGPETSGGASGNVDQIIDGLDQADLDALVSDYPDPLTGESSQPRIPSAEQIESTDPMWVSGDTGFEASLERPLESIVGVPKLIPLYDRIVPIGGTRAEYHIVGWGLVTVTDVELHGGPSRQHLTIQKILSYYGPMTPQPDLSSTAGTIAGAFTSPALVQ